MSHVISENHFYTNMPEQNHPKPGSPASATGETQEAFPSPARNTRGNQSPRGLSEQGPQQVILEHSWTGVVKAPWLGPLHRAMAKGVEAEVGSQSGGGQRKALPQTPRFYVVCLKPLNDRNLKIEHSIWELHNNNE